jgi:phage baseplate assembly protein W
MATVSTQTTRRFQDLDLNFKIHPVRKDINKHVGEMAVVNSVKNLVSTKHYEVPFQPDVGSNLHKLLFEPLDSVTATLLERELTEVINNFEPRASVQTVNINLDYDNSRYNVEMVFKIINSTNPVTIKFFLDRVR